MAVTMSLEFPGTTEQYDEVNKKMDIENDPPAGLIVHTCADVGGGNLKIIDVWESEDAYRKFSDDRLGPGEVTITLTVHHSRFEPDRIQVAPGTTVRFVVDNGDPIGHELIVGNDEVHRRHEQGTEPAHAPRPGEVSVPALATAETTFAFLEPGSVLYACHLPGHLRYGMSGYVDVALK